MYSLAHSYTDGGCCLDTRKTSVTLVTMNSEEKIQLTQDEVAKGIEIEERIVNTVVA